MEDLNFTIQTAWTFANELNLPLYLVSKMEADIFAHSFEREIEFPFLSFHAEES